MQPSDPILIGNVASKSEDQSDKMKTISGKDNSSDHQEAAVTGQ